MTKRTIVAALAAVLTLSACGDSTAPAAIQLTDAQAEDLMEALALVGGATAFSQQAAEYRASATQLLTMTVDQTDACPNGGTYRMQGTFTGNDAGTSATAAITQSYNACKAMSSNDVLWTFNGAPNIVINFTMTSNPTTGAFTMNGTQKGAIDASSSVGSGRCAIDLTYSMQGNDNTGAMNMSVTGSVCGRTITVTISDPGTV